MDKIEKLLRNISRHDRKKIMMAVFYILENELDTLDMIKMKGYIDIYRVRVGKYRIFFKKAKSKNVILDVKKRMIQPIVTFLFDYLMSNL